MLLSGSTKTLAPIAQVATQSNLSLVHITYALRGGLPNNFTHMTSLGTPP